MQTLINKSKFAKKSSPAFAEPSKKKLSFFKTQFRRMNQFKE